MYPPLRLQDLTPLYKVVDLFRPLGPRQLLPRLLIRGLGLHLRHPLLRTATLLPSIHPLLTRLRIRFMLDRPLYSPLVWGTGRPRQRYVPRHRRRPSVPSFALVGRLSRHRRLSRWCALHQVALALTRSRYKRTVTRNVNGRARDDGQRGRKIRNMNSLFNVGSPTSRHLARPLRCWGRISSLRPPLGLRPP